MLFFARLESKPRKPGERNSLERRLERSLGGRVGRGTRAERVRRMAGQERRSGADQQSAATSDSAGDDSGPLSAIRRTWPWLTEDSAKLLADEVRGGRCPELEQQLKISEQGREKQNSPMSNVLVTVTSDSAFVRAFVDAYLQLLVDVQVCAPSPCSLRASSFSLFRSHLTPHAAFDSPELSPRPAGNALTITQTAFCSCARGNP